ncbi:CMP-sialic acid transporter 4 [Platanthera guangdongensis]|uniref:CMP-sialic acid transporter 4 n=1 Tax=Platanthera guangdongensis TaxID=2320717 RepID=A0ABR2LKN1_9ASPA
MEAPSHYSPAPLIPDAATEAWRREIFRSMEVKGFLEHEPHRAGSSSPIKNLLHDGSSPSNENLLEGNCCSLNSGILLAQEPVLLSQKQAFSDLEGLATTNLDSFEQCGLSNCFYFLFSPPRSALECSNVLCTALFVRLLTTPCFHGQQLRVSNMVNKLPGWRKQLFSFPTFLCCLSLWAKKCKSMVLSLVGEGRASLVSGILQPFALNYALLSIFPRNIDIPLSAEIFSYDSRRGNKTNKNLLHRKSIKGINFSPDSEGNEPDRLVCLAGGRNGGGARRGLKQRRRAEEEDSKESALEARVEAAEGTTRRNRLHGARVERRNCGAQKLSTYFDEVGVYSIPAALYLIKNLLQYSIFAYVDARMYQILSNLNIISTGVLYCLILKRKEKLPAAGSYTNKQTISNPKKRAERIPAKEKTAEYGYDGEITGKNGDSLKDRTGKQMFLGRSNAGRSSAERLLRPGSVPKSSSG